MAGVDLNWNLLTDASANFGNALANAGQVVGDRRRKAADNNALAAVIANPDDPTAYNALAQRDPGLALQARDMQRREAGYQRDLTKQKGIAEAIDPATGKLDPGKYRTALAGAGDAEGLLSFDKLEQDRRQTELKTYAAVNDHALQLLGGVRDQATYEAAISQAKQLYDRFNIEMPPLPPAYNPETVRQLQVASLDTKEQLDFALKEKADERSERREDRSERRAGAAEGRAIAAERRAQVRFGERDKDRAALAAGGIVRRDMGDLDY